MDEHHLDWLIATGHSAAAKPETAALQARMRDLRRRGLQRTQWRLVSFLEQYAKPAAPATWAERVRAAQRRLQSATPRERSPLEWAELAPQLLKDIGWPGESLQPSAEFQAARRLQQVMDLCGSLGFDGRRIAWKDFLADLDRALAETLFSPESQDAPILIAGPAESAGLTADAIWFLGASEDAWPARGSLHPLLPSPVQRNARMPHASPQLDWELAHAIATRLLISAPDICFSHTRQIEGVDFRPSRIVARLAGAPEPLPLNLVPPPAPSPLTIRVEDEYQIPLPPLDRAPGESKETHRTHAIRGGSKVLTMQSQCPFKAFATGRLGAESWDLAEAGLSASVRGKLLHSVMHAIWGGPPRGIRTRDQLLGIADRRNFVASHVQDVMQNELPGAARELLPKRYLDLEVQRLTQLVSQWLEYEEVRLPFTVIGTELNTKTEIGELSLDLRLDRIDQLNDRSLLVVDYKTGAVSPSSWNVPRPDDVQLPLYGGFALDQDAELGGFVVAKIRAGDVCFTGRVGDVGATLGFALRNSSSLKKNQFKAEQLMEWRDEILRLARDYFDGRADVDPRNQKLTCDRCGLQTLCRIQEMQVIAEEEELEDADE
jgi:probable DNA repair protein